MKRSSIIAGIAAAIVGGQAVYLAAAGKGELLRPPGAQSESDFMARCVKCGKCLEACPYRAVHVAPGNAGAAAGTPVIDAREQACRLCEDFPCVAACPTGALRDVEARADVHMGTAVIEEDLCKMCIRDRPPPFRCGAPGRRAARGRARRTGAPGSRATG